MCTACVCTAHLCHGVEPRQCSIKVLHCAGLLMNKMSLMSQLAMLTSVMKMTMQAAPWISPAAVHVQPVSWHPQPCPPGRQVHLKPSLLDVCISISYLIRTPFQCMFGHLSGSKTKSQPRHNGQSNMCKYLYTLHIQYNIGRDKHTTRLV